MPSKSYLMGLKTATDVVEYALNNLEVKELLKYVKIKANGEKEIKFLDNNDMEFIGSGLTNKEACADAVSDRFPVETYPDPV
jgi:hypothetical protein